MKLSEDYQQTQEILSIINNKQENENYFCFNLISFTVFITSYVLFYLINKYYLNETTQNNNKKQQKEIKSKPIFNEKSKVSSFNNQNNKLLTSTHYNNYNNKKEEQQQQTVTIEKEDSLKMYQRLITVYSEQGDLFKVINLYEKMNRENIKPDIIVYEALILMFIKKNKLAQSLSIVNDIKLNKLKMKREIYNKLLNAMKTSKTINEKNVNDLKKIKHFVCEFKELNDNNNNNDKEENNKVKGMSDNSCSTSTCSLSPRNSVIYNY